MLYDLNYTLTYTIVIGLSYHVTFSYQVPYYIILFIYRD